MNCETCIYYTYQPENSDADGYCNHFGEEVDITQRCKFYSRNPKEREQMKCPELLEKKE